MDKKQLEIEQKANFFVVFLQLSRKPLILHAFNFEKK
jgi:hypothetical protein